MTKKQRFVVDLSSKNRERILYNRDVDVFMFYAGQVSFEGKILLRFEHPWVGTFYLGETGKIFVSILTYKEY